MKKTTRRDFLKEAGSAATSAAMLPLLSSCCSLGNNSTTKKPNIIFIMADDHSTDAISCYGSSINKTPNIDRLAREGMKSLNCFCTNSICVPSRATILTGKYGHITGVTGNRIPLEPGQTTFPKLLQAAGYQTAMIGKWHLRSEPQGFDYYSILSGAQQQGTYYDPAFNENGREKILKGYTTDIITDVSMDWLENRSKEKPFLLMCHHKAPHRKWKPDKKHASLYEGIDIPEPETFNDDYATRSDAAIQQEMTIEHHLDKNDLKVEPPKNLTKEQLKKWKYQRYIKDYLRCVASIDDNVGRLLKYLDDAYLTDNTVVIYTSDQGFFLGDHGWFDKRFMYEESLRMPFLIRYPKTIKPGTTCDEMILNLDFAPTILELAKADKPSDMQGESFKNILQGKKVERWRKSMYYHYSDYPAAHMVKKHYGIRTDRYKLIHFYHDIDAWELYDLKNDLDELNNVYDDPGYIEVVKKLKEELESLQKKYKDVKEPI